MSDLKKIAVLITTSVKDEAASLSSLNACKTLVQESVLVDHIFFYFDAVYHASPESSLHKQWNIFSKSHGIPLIACSTLASNRKLDDSDKHEFQFAGLSEFFSRLHHCDKVIQY